MKRSSTPPPLPCRVCVVAIAPATAKRRWARAQASPADIALFDLEDSLSAENRPAARAWSAEQRGVAVGTMGKAGECGYNPLPNGRLHRRSCREL